MRTADDLFGDGVVGHGWLICNSGRRESPKRILNGERAPALKLKLSYQHKIVPMDQFRFVHIAEQFFYLGT